MSWPYQIEAGAKESAVDRVAGSLGESLSSVSESHLHEKLQSSVSVHGALRFARSLVFPVCIMTRRRRHSPCLLNYVGIDGMARVQLQRPVSTYFNNAWGLKICIYVSLYQLSPERLHPWHVGEHVDKSFHRTQLLSIISWSPTCGAIVNITP